LDPNLAVVDAVSRDPVPSGSNTIITASNGGSCLAQTFNLSNMNINYESINTSTGIDNSFSRRVDGDCGWVKTTAISAHAPNKTGSTSSASYQFSTLSASECSGSTGSISIAVSASDVAALFPMSYTLAYDTDSNGIFGTDDLYRNGSDSSASSIDIANLAYGRYRITVGSSSGCNLKTFDFFIFNCYGVALPYKQFQLFYEGSKNNYHHFYYNLEDSRHITELQLEAGNGGIYKKIQSVYAPFSGSDQLIKAPVDKYLQYRLRIVEASGVITYSAPVQVRQQSPGIVYPNPAADYVYFQLNGTLSGNISYTIYNHTGIALLQGQQHVAANQRLLVATKTLSPGIYFIRLAGPAIPGSTSFRFKK
ncbi:MAG: T9SS type A sorting domain-containing protein, partial [Chitinophagaceae bacterium]